MNALAVGRLEAPSIVTLAAQPVALIPIVVERGRIGEVMGPGLSELFAALAAQSIVPSGPWFTHHKQITDQTFDFEICLPVEAHVSRSGRVVAGERRAMRAFRAAYSGPYEGLSGAWIALHTQIAQSGQRVARDLFEVYAVGPDASSNADDWRTELIKPIDSDTPADLAKPGGAAVDTIANRP